MPTFTFRCEIPGDDKHVPRLLAQMGITDYVESEISEATFPRIKLGVFTVQSDLDLVAFKAQMESAVDDSVYDLHRCYQTLAEGDKPSW